MRRRIRGVGLCQGSRDDDLLSLTDGLRRVSRVREVNSALANGWAESKPNSVLKNHLGATFDPDCVPVCER